MKHIKIEFFHDIICSFCFPMSYEMRQLTKQYADIEVVHRSFALAPTSDDMKYMFGSHEQAKAEILTHWQRANQLDALHRFNIEGMRSQSFLFPTSMPALRACATVRLMKDEETYWNLFDLLQNQLFVQNKDISNPEVITKCVSQLGIDLTTFNELVSSKQVEDEVLADFARANLFNITSVPSLVVNDTYVIRGWQAFEKLVEILNDIDNNTIQGAACGIDSCD